MFIKKKYLRFQKINFCNLLYEDIEKKLNTEGGLLVAPAASALSQIKSNKEYYTALKKSDIVILDSGFFCILLRLFRGLSVNRLSGYLFLKKFLNREFTKKNKIFLIDPNKNESKFNKLYLNKKKIKTITSYIAPDYQNNKFQDKNLIKMIKKKKPNIILVNIGGGTQESLGLFIKENINFKCSIICTGAAIAFLTKRQAPINELIDRLYLGWLIRTIYNPKRYFLRNLHSLLLIKLFF